MVRAALLLAALTLLMTMPVAASAGSLFAAGVVDPPFTMWTMASQVHALETNPVGCYHTRTVSEKVLSRNAG
jgi:hypothetical protein